MVLIIYATSNSKQLEGKPPGDNPPPRISLDEIWGFAAAFRGLFGEPTALCLSAPVEDRRVKKLP